MSPTAARLASVRAIVAAAAARAARDPADVTLVAVTKGVSDDGVVAAVAAGVHHLAESRVHAAEARRPACAGLAPPPTWHLIGHLQRNKARRAVAFFQRIDSVDSRRLAADLDRLAAERNHRLPVLIEVDWTGDVARTGLPPAEVEDAAAAIAGLPHLELLGLMTLARDAGPEAARAVFRQTRLLAGALRRHMPERDNPVLSMGMSGDFEIAVEEGATEIRVGSALFGGAEPLASPQPQGQAHE